MKGPCPLRVFQSIRFRTSTVTIFSHANAWELHPLAELTELNAKGDFCVLKGASPGHFMGKGGLRCVFKGAAAGNFMGRAV